MTSILSFSDVDEIGAVLDAGAVIAIPTDTVYGVGARLADEAAVQSLFVLKERPENVALPVLIGSLDQLTSLGIELTGLALVLAQSFWPGPLTIVVPAPANIAELVGSITATVGVRMPGDDDLRRLLEWTGPMAVTSANTHGEPACENAAQVLGEFEGRGNLGAVIDGGTRSAAPSTVVLVSHSTYSVLREGSISREQIDAICS